MTPTDRTTKSLRRRTFLATAMALIGLAGAACAQAYVYQDTDAVDLKVVDRDTGQVLRVWRHDGRLFVAGQPGARYSLRVTNHTDGRVLVVMSVDGVNILTGETASYDQRGYVFDPHESYDVNGWRKSNTQVAAFAFAPLSQSYAARTGRPTEVGVIGMAVFDERVAVPEPEPLAIAPDLRDGESRGGGYPGDAPSARQPMQRPSSVGALAGALVAPSPSPPPPADASRTEDFGERSARRQDEKLGTAHGAREWSVVNTTTFERATPYPQSVRQIEYDTYAHLVAAGVIPPPSYEDHRPRPFPQSPDGEGYVPDPPG
jgi:hypothetical protein